ncbi:Cysteine desulfurase [Botrimarina colliarenosi]|uniref:cysteine desulfurase n=1 Tax=Botrimarina colliarenosi TaxID=2528001 RepID=A0A5C6A8Z0_9BACT|nr:cysteine desulfurase family protein [Botrimarina colliarenosi]TWT96019.1 Cysteine desulfurase [Botrimarina colliarenosi]
MIYLDNHATTRVDPRVVEAMLPWFTEEYGNPGSVVHPFGEAAREAVAESRSTIAAVIDADPEEIVFTSGATESNNLAIRGVVERPRQRGDHLVSVATEHRAVLDPLNKLRQRGYAVTLLGVESHGSPRAGRLDPQQVADALTDKTCLVSVMLANNEIGVLQPIREVAEACRERGVLLHCDATQAVGKRPVSVRDLGVDLMSFTAHKLYGPKGIGALYVRRSNPIVRLEGQINGGGQERGRRSGTLNVPGIVGFAKAVSLCQAEQPAEAERLGGLRDQLFSRLRDGIAGLALVGPGLDTVDASGQPLRLAHNLNVSLPGIDGETLMLQTPEIALSSGAACSASDPEPSHVLQALGMSPDEARCTLRIGLGRFTTAGEVEAAADRIVAAATALRGLSSR